MSQNFIASPSCTCIRVIRLEVHTQQVSWCPLVCRKLWAGEIDEPGTEEDAAGVLTIEEAQQPGGNEESSVTFSFAKPAHANSEQKKVYMASLQAAMHSFTIIEHKVLNI
jgi:hypothetical protein